MPPAQRPGTAPFPGPRPSIRAEYSPPPTSHAPAAAAARAEWKRRDFWFRLSPYPLRTSGKQFTIHSRAALTSEFRWVFPPTWETTHEESPLLKISAFVNG